MPQGSDMAVSGYHAWILYPRWVERSCWVETLLEFFRKSKESIDSISLHIKSDRVVTVIITDLEINGYIVEGGDENKTIYQPVYFGENAKPSIQ